MRKASSPGSVTETYLRPTMLTRLVASARARLAERLRNRITGTRDRLVERYFTLPAKYKGGMIEKWALYWRQLSIDYVEVAMSVVRFGRTQPLRATIYTAATVAVYQCAQLNPTRTDFIRALRQQTGQLVLVDERCQKREASEFLRDCERQLNEGRLRHVNLGLVSLMWSADHDAAVALYRTTCTYTAPHWRTFGERIVDVGFCGRWWIMQQKMENYDVVDED